MDHPPPVIWDEKHLKALLRIRRYPLRLIQEMPWQAWIEQRGGEKQVVEHLRTSPLPHDYKQLLELILAHPNTSTLLYAKKLNMGHSSYFVQLKGLVQALLIELNQWRTAPILQRKNPATNLPMPLTSLIGAGKSLEAVITILRRPGTRLVTLIGPGGVGKTRLASEAGAALLEDFDDGVFFVPLETISDPALVVTQIARSLNIETVGGTSLLDTLKTHFHNQRTLLILDNFEQVTQSAGTVMELLQAASYLKIVVTSREALNVYGENRYVVPELNRPDPDNLPSPEELSRWPAMELFVQRVQARHHEFVVNEANLPTIAKICHRLEGLPLAIELAAAQVRFLLPDHTLPELEHGLRKLQDPSRNRSSRQKTLWDAINWSYQLLPEPERAIFRQLAVFGHEWSLEAAETVCQVDNLLASLDDLVDKSLLRYIGHTVPVSLREGKEGGARFQMLQPVREFALERLADSVETEQVQRRHAVYFLEMTERAEPFIGTPEQLHWMRRIKQERENLQIAIQWMLNQQETEMAFRLLGAAWRYYNMLNIWDETKSWMDLALTTSATSSRRPSGMENAARAKTLWGAYWLTVRQNGDHTKALTLARKGLRIARACANPRLTGLMLQCMVVELQYREQYDEALHAAEESVRIFRALGDQDETAWALGHMSAIFSQRGDRAKGRKILEESLSIFRAIGDDWAVEQVLRDLAMLFWQQGELEQVKIALEESLTRSEKLGDRMGISWTLNFQGRLALRQSDFKTARRLFGEAQVIFEKLGDPYSLSYNRECMEQLAAAENGNG